MRQLQVNFCRSPRVHPSPSSNCGVTIVEILMVLGVASLLASLAMPSLQGWLLQHRVAVTTNALVSAFYVARQTAVQRQRPVALCAGSDGRCHESGRANWTAGWLMFHDDNRSGQIDDGEPLIHTGEPSNPGLSLSANSPLRKSVIFTPLGVAQQPGGAFSAGRLRICARGVAGNNARDLVLAKSGRVRLEETGFAGDCPTP